MRCAVIYSSRTGNTKLVAEAIFAAMPEGTKLLPVAEAPAPESFDCLALGFWADKGKPDAAMLAYMEKARGKNLKLGLFGTLGAYPDSDHGRQFMAEAKAAVAGNEVLAEFCCMGKVDPAILAMMEKMRAKGDNIHPMTPERAARIAEAEKHPDAADLAAAKTAFAPLAAQNGEGHV